MRPVRAMFLTVVVVASAGCGSVSYYDVSGDASVALNPSAPRMAEFLLAASESKDIDEIDAAAAEEADVGRDSTIPTQTGQGGRAKKIAARAGLLLASSAEDVDREPGMLAGLSYDLIGGTGSMAIELGADFGSMSDATGDVTSQITMVSGTGRFSFGSVFLLGGASIIVDDYEDVPNDESGTSYIPVFEAGLGLRVASGSIDLRASYMALIGSENVPGLMTVKAGLAF
jgi:hypothetical protein